jgi:retron-type reverse transcriptase
MSRVSESKPKSFEISKWAVWEAYRRVKANKGAAGVDEQSIEEFERDLSGNLFKLWNRLSSGSYFPPPVRAVAIPKRDGSSRMLGVPTVISYCCVLQRAFGFVGGHASLPSAVGAAGRGVVCAS